MKYTFDGQWEFYVELEKFNQLEYENSTTETKIIINDFLDDEIEPFQEQINTINFLIENQESIVDKLLDRIWINWKEIYVDYSIDDYRGFPKIKSKSDLKSVIGIQTIYIQPLYKNGYSYYGLEGNCMWDEEHGLGFINHKERIIDFGGAEEAYAGGGETKDNPDNQRPKEPSTPKLYNRHPIFENFKPSHKEANVEYPHKLIEKNLLNTFHEYIQNNPNVDYVNPDDWQKRTYLQTACRCNNELVFNLLLPKAKNLENAIYYSHKRKNIDFIKRLIDKGADIHERHYGTSILTEAVEEHLRTISVNLTEEQMDANQKRMIDYYNHAGINKFSPIVKEVTMHPKEWIERSRKYIQYLIQYSIELDQKRIDYVKNGSRNNLDALGAIEKELNWIMSIYK